MSGGPADFLPGFNHGVTAANGVEIAWSAAGQGPALLLLHGHPQTRIVWRHVAPRLVAAGYRVVAPDLRGYGDSAKPTGGPPHAAYSKREMAADQVALMRALGHETFAVIGHDRGGRVAHRMALDHPDAVTHLVVADIAPTATMYARTDKDFASAYFWWFFLIQPFDLPERMIGADPEHFLRTHLAGHFRDPAKLEDAAVREYLRCYRDPACLHAICEDYRAAATIDLEHDAADAEARIAAPVLALWGAHGFVARAYDVTATWQEKAPQVTGLALPSGHAVPEEAPKEMAEAILDFLAS